MNLKSKELVHFPAIPVESQLLRSIYPVLHLSLVHELGSKHADQENPDVTRRLET